MTDQPAPAGLRFAAGKLVVALAVAATAAIGLALTVERLLANPAALQMRLCLEDGWLFALALGAGVLASALNIGANDRTLRARLATGAAFALVTGALVGLAKAASFVLANRYLALGMVRLAVAQAAAIVSTYVLAALVVFALAVALPAALPAFARGGWGRRLLLGALPVLAILAFVGFHLNRFYLPGVLEPLSLLGNTLWIAACAVLLWPLGWLSQRLALPVARLTGRRASSAALQAAALAVLALVVTNLALAGPAAGRPNIVIVSIDTLRADHLGCYGYRRPTSPNLDRLAAGGVLFRNAIAQAPWTLPSHMSILTGLYPSGHGAVSEEHRLAPRFVTLAEVLQQEGYLTVGITDGGFLGRKYGYQGFDRFDDGGRAGPRGWRDLNVPPPPAGLEHVERGENRAAGVMVDKALRFLNRRRQERPFLLFLHTYQVHCPYDPPPEWDRFSDPAYRGVVQIQGTCNFEPVKAAMGAADYQHLVDKYDGEIAYTDAQLGRLFAELEALGLDDTSVILITSDHGENLGDHPHYPVGHAAELHDHTLRVPLILKAPGLRAGTVIDGQVESVDILPTLLDLFGLELPEAVDGVSLVEILGTGAREKEFAYSEEGPAHRMVRTDRWKLIVSRRGEYELYDLSADPGEQRDLLSTHREVARELRLQLEAWAAEQDRRLEGNAAEIVDRDAALEEQLRALGYLE